MNAKNNQTIHSPLTIAVAGKGGTGKTTIAALLIHHLKSKGLTPILAVDADPNANLNTLLGFEVEKTIGQLEQETLTNKDEIPPGMAKKRWIELNLQQLLIEGRGTDMLVMGRGEGPSCYCAINNILREYLNSLTKNYQTVVLDNEAGMEHISRRTTSDIDILLIITDDNPVAVDSAARIDQLVDELGITVAKRYLLINKVDSPLPRKANQKIEQLNLEVIGTVPQDDELVALCWEGKPIDKISTDAPAFTASTNIVNLLLEETGLSSESSEQDYLSKSE